MALLASAPTQWRSRTSFSSSFTPRFVLPEGLKCVQQTRQVGYPIVRCHVKSVIKRKKTIIIPPEHKWMYEGIPGLSPEVWKDSYYPKEAEHLNVKKKWYIVDATNMRLGRMASTIAYYLRGKDSPMFTPSLDMGAYVVVVNAEKVGVTGRKRTQKLYRRHSGRPGGLKEETFDHLQKRIPERIVEHAVRGMLPKNRLGRAVYRKLKVFKGPDHPHGAQMPKPLPIKDKRIMLDVDTQF